MKKPNVKALLSMLTYCRPHGGQYVEKFAEKFLASPNRVDLLGNRYFEVGEGSRTLFVAHMDSVHHTDGIQDIVYDTNLNIVYKEHGSKECLGADDASGVWLLTELMRAGVPGVYVYTSGEERGGIGAKHVAKDPEFLARFDRAIAFDRKGTQSIITDQAYGRCCSDEFAIELGARLGMGHVPDDSGVYTDTAEFVGVIPECTNISVGYVSEHTPHEVQDVEYLLALRKACIKLDWESLPIHRDPKEEIESQNRWRSSRRRWDMEFTIVECPNEFKLYDEDNAFLTKHKSLEYIEGYAACYAEVNDRDIVLIYENQAERNLKLAGYDLDELESDNPYNQWVDNLEPDNSLKFKRSY